MRAVTRLGSGGLSNMVCWHLGEARFLDVTLSLCRCATLQPCMTESILISD